ncbi:oxidoreductase-like domain-containing protein [Marinobacterium arenosum]|nr:oxidoreductase-like domain-containing protein [Marinobacterium arenosum]MBY4675222.1 oxidoreductase-like domain-containing protein [Marinobacterium arenosum]
MNERPTPPADNECCESGCSPCVWDTYYEDLHAWQAQQASQASAQASDD